MGCKVSVSARIQVWIFDENAQSVAENVQESYHHMSNDLLLFNWYFALVSTDALILGLAIVNTGIVHSSNERVVAG